MCMKNVRNEKVREGGGYWGTTKGKMTDGGSKDTEDCGRGILPLITILHVHSIFRGPIHTCGALTNITLLEMANPTLTYNTVHNSTNTHMVLHISSTILGHLWLD
ncbi:unnamed protein product [Lota lota]